MSDPDVWWFYADTVCVGAYDFALGLLNGILLHLMLKYSVILCVRNPGKRYIDITAAATFFIYVCTCKLYLSAGIYLLYYATYL